MRAAAYNGRHSAARENARAAHNSASAVQPVRIWCISSHHSALVTRNATMAPMRSTYKVHATDHHRKYLCLYLAKRYQQKTAVPRVTRAWSSAASSSAGGCTCDSYPLTPCTGAPNIAAPPIRRHQMHSAFSRRSFPLLLILAAGALSLSAPEPVHAQAQAPDLAAAK